MNVNKNLKMVKKNYRKLNKKELDNFPDKIFGEFEIS